MANDSSQRIVRDLQDWIGSAGPGAQLPSTRSLVEAYGASPLTVQKALRVLAGQDLIESRPGIGTFVRAVRTARPVDFGWQTAALRAPTSRGSAIAGAMRQPSEDVVALHSGYPDRELLPEKLVRAALARASRDEKHLARSPTAGLHELQAWFARELEADTTRGVTPPAPTDVIVLPGSQSGLSSIFRALVTPSAPLLLESPTYWGAILAATQAGLRVVPVPTTAQGPDPEELDRAFAESGARVFYAQPNFANPTGAQWSGRLARRVLDVVRSHGAFLIEDDWAHDFGIDSDAVPLAAHDDSGHVVYLRSLTKSVSPALRVAAVIARGPVRERILVDRGAEGLYVSGVLQAAALDVVTQPGWQTYRRGLRQQLRTRRDLLHDALRNHAPTAGVEHLPPGGLNLWARLPHAVNLDQLVRDCESDGLLIAPGGEWFPAEPPANFARLNYSGPTPSAFPGGARILEAALQRQR